MTNNNSDCSWCSKCSNCFSCRKCENLVNGFMCDGLKLEKKDSTKYWKFNKEITKEEWDKL